MNIFTLFETENIEDIKTGLQVVKTLGYQKDFEVYFNKSFEEYEDILIKFFIL